MVVKELCDECNQFVAVRNMLHGIGTSSSDPVFVSWAGRPMSSALVGDQFAMVARYGLAILDHNSGTHCLHANTIENKVRYKLSFSNVTQNWIAKKN